MTTNQPDITFPSPSVALPYPPSNMLPVFPTSIVDYHLVPCNRNHNTFGVCQSQMNKIG